MSMHMQRVCAYTVGPSEGLCTPHALGGATERASTTLQALELEVFLWGNMEWVWESVEAMGW